MPEKNTYKAYVKATKNTDVKECPICLDEFKQEEKVKVLECSDKHVFHRRCLED